jgi:hypothetical protein
MNAAADQGPAGLVVMALARLDHRDGKERAPPQQARRGRKARGPAAHDHHVVGLARAELDHTARRRGEFRDSPAHLQPRAQRRQIVAGVGRGGEDRVRIEMMRFCQRPEGGRAGAGAAEREHGPLKLGERIGKGHNVVIGDLAGDHRDVAIGEADPFRRGGDRGARRLVLGLAVGAVVDDRAKALGGERPEVGLGDLW